MSHTILSRPRSRPWNLAAHGIGFVPAFDMPTRLIFTGIVLAILAIGCERAPEAERTKTVAPVEAKESVANEAELAGILATLVNRSAQVDRFSGAVLLTRGNKPIFRRAYGLADRESGSANTPETLFALGSVSKMFTAVLAARLVEQGRMTMDATIGSLLPEFPPGQARSQVTVHHLLTMSSGIPDVWGRRVFWTILPGARTLSDFWPAFATAPLEFTPGTHWNYSNSNYLVLVLSWRSCTENPSPSRPGGTSFRLPA